MANFTTDGKICIERELPVAQNDQKYDDIDSRFDINETCKWIRDNNFGKVCLQFPDELLNVSAKIYEEIKKRIDVDVYILGDTSYASCCVDSVAAMHVKSDAIVHYGRTCFSKTNIPVHIVLPKRELNIEACIRTISNSYNLDNNMKLCLFYDEEFEHCKDDLTNLWFQHYSQSYVASIEMEDIPDRFLGRVVKNKEGSVFCPEMLRDCICIYIGSKGQTLFNYTISVAGTWVSFFTAAGIPSDVAATYALTFTENRIQMDMLLDLNKEYLRDMGVTRMGDIIVILRHAKQVHENTARDRVLGTTANPVVKVPVAAITGRSTVSQPSSPASRILEHYTRNPQSQEPPAPAQKLKRKSIEFTDDGTDDVKLKKARLIRFGSQGSTQQSEGPSTKQTVFSRLGSNEVTKASKAAVKPIYARLGSKPQEKQQVVPIEKDALKYEGILKSPVIKNTVTVTTTKNNVRRIAMGACTMRADEPPVSVKEKLALPKAKSVKFSNHVQYKEIEVNKKQLKGKAVTTVFNKPERRLSMPETKDVKARLGVKTVTNLTVNRNVFHRLGA